MESGRLFVWGENYFGQLGVGANNNSNSDIITKPTCVKSLKTLGLKIADIAFGHGWAVILTHSNEIFFTGRNIFPPSTKVSENFTSATISGENYSIIRKPFRLEDFDTSLSTSEDQENFTTISAGNEHFAVMTTLGRIIGWGSNKHHQLGSDTTDLTEPYEISLESKVKQFVCGPTSTIILTDAGSLYLNGSLNEFVFPKFTELQKNLPPQEEILFMHISQASEIYIVTNEGGIYRSIESARHNSLIFQRFYDYDSEENGQIVKLLRGTSFFAALTKANKFYTTFSESGHHLKTFREISKFKNLRTLDMVVGDQHILVHGIPRTANKMLNKTFVVRTDSNANIDHIAEPSRIMAQKILEETEEVDQGKDEEETPKPNTPVHENTVDNYLKTTQPNKANNKSEDEKEDLNNIKDVKKDEDNIVEEQKTNGNRPVSTSSSKDLDIYEDSSPTSMRSSRYRRLDDSEADSTSSSPSKKTVLTANADSSSPTSSIKSRKTSGKSIRFDEKSLQQKQTNSAERKIRPRTPYPDGTPQKQLKPLGVDLLDKTSPAFNDSLENIPETATISDNNSRNGSTKITSSAKTTITPVNRNEDGMTSSEEDEQLAVEISSTDFMDKTIVNDIRFINNGVDVTDISKRALSENSPVKEKATKILENAGEAISSATDAVKKPVIDAVDKTVETVSKGKDKVIEGAKENIENVAKEAENTGNMISDKMSAAVSKVSSEVDSAVGKMSEKYDTAVSTISEGVDSTVSTVSNTVSTTINKISTKVDDAKQNLSELFAGGHKEESPNRSSNVSTAVTTEVSTPRDDSKIDDDERTTASVNSNLNGTGTSLETDRHNDFEPVKHTLGEEIRSTGEMGKGKVMQFISDMKAKGKGLSCRDEKAIRIEDDPPKYTPVDEYADGRNKTSKVCTIL